MLMSIVLDACLDYSLFESKKNYTAFPGKIWKMKWLFLQPTTQYTGAFMTFFCYKNPELNEYSDRSY